MHYYPMLISNSYDDTRVILQPFELISLSVYNDRALKSEKGLLTYENGEGPKRSARLRCLINAFVVR